MAHGAVGRAAGMEGVSCHWHVKHWKGVPLMRALRMQPTDTLQQIRTGVPGSQSHLKEKLKEITFLKKTKKNKYLHLKMLQLKLVSKPTNAACIPSLSPAPQWILW